MNSQATGLRVAGTVFGLICLVHLWRLLAGVPVSVGSHEISTVVGVVGVVISGGLSLWMWRLASAAST